MVHSHRRGAPPLGASVGEGYRVELRAGWRAVQLAILDSTAPAHHSSLAPFASRLWLEGLRTGEVVLIDRANGAVVARRRLARPR